MTSDKKNPNGITIVGGRPMHRAVNVGDLPQGVEQVLTLAALDYRFREAVARDPVNAAGAKGISLDAVEASLLRAIPSEKLAHIAERLVIPRSQKRRHFIKGVSASVMAMLTGHAFMLCSGCTGADDWEAPPPQQKWMDLGGHTCLVYLPSDRRSEPNEPGPVMVALHGEDETALSSVQRWQNAVNRYSFSIISVNWTEDAPTPELKDRLAQELGTILKEFGQHYAVSERYLCSRGASTDIVFRAGHLGASAGGWSGSVFLGGVPAGDWITDAATLLSGIVAAPPALYYVLGTQDPEYAQGQAFHDALFPSGARLLLDTPASTEDAVLNFSEIWAWLVAQ